VSDDAMVELLEETKRHDGLLQVHAETWDVIQRESEKLTQPVRGDPMLHARAHSVSAEEDAIKRVAEAVAMTDSRMYIVHLSSARGLAQIRRAREKGVRLRAESCPQYLTLTEERYDEPSWGGAKYVMSPPLRPAGNPEALWGGIRDGLIQTIGTDHCPFNFKGQKDMNGRDDWRVIPNGAPGIETMLMLLYSEGVAKGRISIERMVDVLSTSTARTFGLARKGAVAPGMDADVVVFDPSQRFTIRQSLLHQNVDYTPWEGWEVTGMPRAVFSRGRRVAEWAGDRVRFVGTPGAGRFVLRQPIGPL
jgi:dihydropyrimidinase